MHIIAPVESRLYGAQGGGTINLCAPTFGSLSKGELGAGGFSRIFMVIFSMPKHSTPNKTKKKPIARKKALHMAQIPPNNSCLLMIRSTLQPGQPTEARFRRGTSHSPLHHFTEHQ
jgi:hypothetical protein